MVVTPDRAPLRIVKKVCSFQLSKVCCFRLPLILLQTTREIGGLEGVSYKRGFESVMTPFNFGNWETFNLGNFEDLFVESTCSDCGEVIDGSESEFCDDCLESHPPT